MRGRILITLLASLMVLSCDEKMAPVVEEVEVVEKRIVMSYQVGSRERVIEMLGFRRRSDLEEGARAIAKRLAKPTFSSRFFEDGDELWDLTAVVSPRWSEVFQSSSLVFNETEGRLIVQGSLESHRAIQRAMLPVCHMETKIRLLEVEGVSLSRRSVKVSDLPKTSIELAEISCGHPNGETVLFESKENGFKLEVKGGFDEDDPLIEYDFTLSGDYEGAPVSLKTSGVVFSGVPRVLEVGSLNGGKTLVAVFTIELFLADGSPFDHWILSEEEGAVLEGSRLSKASDRAGLPDLTASGIHCFHLPVGIEREFPYLSPVKAVHELGDGEWEDLIDLQSWMHGNGVSLKGGEFVVFRKKTRIVYVKAEGENLDFMSSIIRSYQGGMPLIARVDFLEVESLDRVNAQTLKNGEFEIRSKIGMTTLEGRVCEVALSSKLWLNFEIQIDHDRPILEGRATFDCREGDFKNPIYRAGFVGEFDRPLVLLQSKSGGKWLAIVAVPSVVNVYGEAKE